MDRIEARVYVLGTSAVDLLRCRFAVSPLWELNVAVRTTHRPAGQRWHLPWLTAVAALDPPDGLALLQAMQPARGYTPDFLAPTPTGPSTSLHEEIERVAHTPMDRLAQELALCRTHQRDPVAHQVLDELLTDPARARSRIAAALLTCWDALLGTYWPEFRICSTPTSPAGLGNSPTTA